MIPSWTVDRQPGMSSVLNKPPLLTVRSMKATYSGIPCSLHFSWSYIKEKTMFTVYLIALSRRKFAEEAEKRYAAYSNPKGSLQLRRRRLDNRQLKINIYLFYEFREWLDVLTVSSGVRTLLS